MSNFAVTSPPLDSTSRCRWARGDALLAGYHDLEWGRRIDTDAGHLERMALEIFQCGLSWRIVLVKREALRAAFDGFDPPRVAAMTGRNVARILARPDVIRNRRKIEATIHNAARFVELASEFGSFQSWLDQVRVETPARRKAAFAEFRSRFRFMGPETTKCYLWGVGKVAPPHERSCWMRTGKTGKAFPPSRAASM